MKAILLDEAKKWLEENCESLYTKMAVFGLMQSMPTVDYQEEPNEPLSIEQLREMDGEPVWVQTPGIPKYGRWVIVAGVDTEDGQRTLYCQGDYTCRNYGRDWLAYRRPPEGEV